MVYERSIYFSFEMTKTKIKLFQKYSGKPIRTTGLGRNSETSKVSYLYPKYFNVFIDYPQSALQRLYFGTF